jgi:hypothetical protein
MRKKEKANRTLAYVTSTLSSSRASSDIRKPLRAS